MEIKRNFVSRKSVRKLLSKSSLSLQTFTDNNSYKKGKKTTDTMNPSVLKVRWPIRIF
mgnify:CR=1 FL=1